MKKILIVVMLIIMLAALAGCAQEDMVTNAIIRYFDGSSEMVILKSYNVLNGTATLYTAEGRKIVTDTTNVIIVTEPDEWR